MNASANDRVFSVASLASIYMMRKDLAEAGIPFEDAQGRRADFHALRMSLNTHLAKRKLPPRRAKNRTQSPKWLPD
jgi:hypothetical protein